MEKVTKCCDKEVIHDEASQILNTPISEEAIAKSSSINREEAHKLHLNVAGKGNYEVLK